MKSFRRKTLWKHLITKLNENPNHLLEDINNLKNKTYSYDQEEDIKTISYYVCQLALYDFIEIKKYKNQNDKEIKKIFLKCERIPRKLTPKHFEQFEDQPWLRWFLFP